MLALVPQHDLLELPDPAAFLAENHVGFVVNTESLRQIEGYFNPAQFDPIKVAWVQHDGGRALRIVDGFTRTYFAARHADKVRDQYPQFRFTMADVTPGLLANPTINEPGASHRAALTPTEYLRAVIPPTVVHPAIAERRVAAYIAVAWRDLIGNDLADQYSALAALLRLADSDDPRPHFTGETSDDQTIIAVALETLQEILEQASALAPRWYTSTAITEALLLLMSRGDTAIGGERETYRQVIGLMQTSDIHARCVTAAKTMPMPSIEGLKADLAVVLADSLHRTREYNSLLHALRELPIPDVYTVAQSAKPDETYRALVKQQRVKQWQMAYRTQYHRAPPSKVLELLQEFAHRPYEVQDVLAPIQAAEQTLGMADQARAQVEAARAEVHAIGGNTGWYDLTLANWDRSIAEIEGAETPDRLQRAVDRLAARCATIPDAITRQRTMATVTAPLPPPPATVASISPLPLPMMRPAPTPIPALQLPSQHTALVTLRATCASIVTQIETMIGVELDTEMQTAIDRTVQALGRLRYNVPDLPGLVLNDYPQLDQKYTRLLEQYTARAS